MPEPTPATAERPLRVLMLLESLFPGLGGAEIQVGTLALALQARGHRVCVLMPRLEPEQTPGRDDWRGVELYRIDYPRLRLLGGLLLQLKMLLWLLRHRREFDAVHVHVAHRMGAVATPLCRLLGKPVVLKFSGWWEFQRGSLRPQGLMPKLLRLGLKYASAVQAISRRIGDDVRAKGFDPDRVHWVANAVDPSRFLGFEPARRAGAVPRRAVFVGRLVPEKGLDTLFEAWARCFAGRSDWRLRLVGEGADEAALRARAQSLGIAEQVEWVGPSREVEAHLAESDVGLLPSRHEGLSNTLLEYMSAALPVVGTRISGTEDFVLTGQTGWLCEPDDVEGLAAALAAMAAVDDAARAALGAAARQRVLQHAALDAVVGRLLQLYRGQRPPAEA